MYLNSKTAIVLVLIFTIGLVIGSFVMADAIKYLGDAIEASGSAIRTGLNQLS